LAASKEKNRKLCRYTPYINLGRGDALTQKCGESPPLEKATCADLEGGWQPPAPNKGLESNSFFK